MRLKCVSNLPSITEPKVGSGYEARNSIFRVYNLDKWIFLPVVDWLHL